MQSKTADVRNCESNSAVRSFVEGNDKPALLIELKWDKSAEKAITQIKEKNYTQLVKKLGYDGEVLLVGINYSTKTKKHSCVIKNFR